MVFKPLLRHQERLFQHRISVGGRLLVPVMLEFAADHDLLTRHAQHDMNIGRIAHRLLTFVRHLDGDAATDQVIVEFLQPRDMLAHRRLEGVGGFDIVKSDFQRDIHAVLPFSS